MLWFLYQILKFVGIVILPFIVLIRGSLYLNLEHGIPPFISLLGGAGITMLVIFLYFSFFYGRVTGKIGSEGVLTRRLTISFILVAVFCAHGIFFFSAKNFKESSIKQEMRSLHPILALSLSTLIYVDESLIVTDAARSSGDYASWGMKENSSSKHYKQADGYVHAVDLRTKGRGEGRNVLLKVYFWLMGFDTLRHTGTADHLHVQIKR